jgi:hypothetical protein
LTAALAATGLAATGLAATGLAAVFTGAFVVGLAAVLAAAPLVAFAWVVGLGADFGDDFGAEREAGVFAATGFCFLAMIPRPGAAAGRTLREVGGIGGGVERNR